MKFLVETVIWKRLKRPFLFKQRPNIDYVRNFVLQTDWELLPKLNKLMTSLARLRQQEKKQMPIDSYFKR